MTSTDSSIVRLEGSDARIRSLTKDVSGRASIIVRGSEGVMYVGIPNGERGWLDKVAKDHGVNQAVIDMLPEHERAPCGTLTTGLRGHTGRCKKCAALRPQKPRDGEVKTVLKVEGLHKLNLDGLLGFMKGKMEEAFALAQEYDTVIKAIEKIPELKAQMDKLTAQMGDHRQALKYFIEKK